MTIFTPQACAQRRIVSDYNYQKAVDAFYDEDDDDKALDLLNKQIKETPDHLDSRCFICHHALQRETVSLQINVVWTSGGHL